MIDNIRFTIQRTITFLTSIIWSDQTTSSGWDIDEPSHPELPYEVLHCDNCGTRLDEERRCPECNPVE